VAPWTQTNSTIAWRLGHVIVGVLAARNAAHFGAPAASYPLGAKEPFPEAPMADLVLHIHRELLHHLSEVCLLRDLYLHTKPATNGATR
jgi:hypothetical protein